MSIRLLHCCPCPKATLPHILGSVPLGICSQWVSEAAHVVKRDDETQISMHGIHNKVLLGYLVMMDWKVKNRIIQLK